MHSKTISKYIWFGTALRYLQDVKEDFPIHEKSGGILKNINEFLDGLKEFDLPVTLRAASLELEEFRKEINKSSSNHTLTKEKSFQLAKIMNDVRNTLFAEAGGKIAFIVTDKRIDVNKLLSNMPALMAPNIFGLLPDIAKYDITEAGKCIAFERPTAAAFHLLRGTESVLRHFYCSIVKKNRVELMWGQIVVSLRKHKKSPDVSLLNNLDNIRSSFRNPTQHPEKIYNIEDVQDLFGLCIEVINRMVASKEWQPLAK